MKMKTRILAAMAAMMLMLTGAALGESAVPADAQKLDASYTLALNAINSEDYETAKEYLNICFAYCDPQSNPVMYADLLLKRACIDVIEEKTDMALLNLDAALRIQPDLADAYLVRTQIYAAQGNADAAIENLEKYIELTEDTSLYETVAQLHEARGDAAAAQEAYDKFVAGAGKDVEEAGFQAGLYQMQAGKLEEAIASFEAYADNEVYGAGAMFNIGICRMNLGNYAEAAEAFTACEEKGGTYEGLYYNRGICYLMSENWAGGADDFARSLETEPYQADAQYNLGICHMQLGDYEAAVAAFTALIGDGEPEPSETEEPAEAAKGGETAEKPEGTEDVETAETAEEPEDVEIVEVVEETGSEQPAEAAEEKAPVNDGAFYYRAVCNAALGNLEAALADFTTCIDHQYELGQSYYQRAQVYAAMGDTEKQNSDLQNSLKYSN